MIILTLFIFNLLAEVPIWAKVVDDFDECSKFFYKGKEPQGMDQNGKKICQQYENGGNFYASLYSTFHKIPVYSAYTFDPTCSNHDGEKSGFWFIEPQLSGFSADSMQPEKNYDRDAIKSKQAVNDDYSNTGYDRGQLNPNGFQCNEGRAATFTLTNSVPMGACFNPVHWKHWEGAVKDILKAQPKGGTAYLVTGTVPSVDDRIPNQGEFDAPTTRDYQRVTVPTHVWTAVCYKHNVNEELSFSFGYIGLNQPDSRINVKTVPQLNNQLSTLYQISEVKIFIDDCFSEKRKTEDIVILQENPATYDSRTGHV
ncbi:endonuclease domain-containing 1 protein-like [Paramormyrops kingsleyae]|uniref:endonuclease domain-containing 1 protein-like n=1 Tax=Paramormyrops kingsleyae TaxID=1676925 RepID=UPI000CD61A06|nr:endonuclease domain-containing 1 protein-like [Paramormyrops kingsleyae]